MKRRGWSKVALIVVMEEDVGEKERVRAGRARAGEGNKGEGRAISLGQVGKL